MSSEIKYPCPCCGRPVFFIRRYSEGMETFVHDFKMTSRLELEYTDACLKRPDGTWYAFRCGESELKKVGE